MTAIGVAMLVLGLLGVRLSGETNPFLAAISGPTKAEIVFISIAGIGLLSLLAGICIFLWRSMP